MNPDEKIPPVIEYRSLAAGSRPPNSSEVFAGTCGIILGLMFLPLGLVATWAGILLLCAANPMSAESLTPIHRIVSGICVTLFGLAMLMLVRTFFNMARHFFAKKIAPSDSDTTAGSNET